MAEATLHAPEFEVIFTPDGGTVTLTLTREEAEYVLGALGPLPGRGPGNDVYQALLNGAGVDSDAPAANTARKHVRTVR